MSRVRRFSRSARVRRRPVGRAGIAGRSDHQWQGRVGRGIRTWGSSSMTSDSSAPPRQSARASSSPPRTASRAGGLLCELRGTPAAARRRLARRHCTPRPRPRGDGGSTSTDWCGHTGTCGPGLLGFADADVGGESCWTAARSACLGTATLPEPGLVDSFPGKQAVRESDGLRRQQDRTGRRAACVRRRGRAPHRRRRAASDRHPARGTDSSSTRSRAARPACASVTRAAAGAGGRHDHRRELVPQNGMCSSFDVGTEAGTMPRLLARIRSFQ